MMQWAATLVSGKLTCWPLLLCLMTTLPLLIRWRRNSKSNSLIRKTVQKYMAPTNRTILIIEPKAPKS